MSGIRAICTHKRLGELVSEEETKTDTMRMLISLCALFACGHAATIEGKKSGLK